MNPNWHPTKDGELYPLMPAWQMACPANAGRMWSRRFVCAFTAPLNEPGARELYVASINYSHIDSFCGGAMVGCFNHSRFRCFPNAPRWGTQDSILWAAEVLPKAEDFLGEDWKALVNRAFGTSFFEFSGEEVASRSVMALLLASTSFSNQNILTYWDRVGGKTDQVMRAAVGWFTGGVSFSSILIPSMLHINERSVMKFTDGSGLREPVQCKTVRHYHTPESHINANSGSRVVQGAVFSKGRTLEDEVQEIVISSASGLSSVLSGLLTPPRHAAGGPGRLPHFLRFEANYPQS